MGVSAAVVDARFVKPLDATLLTDLAAQTKAAGGEVTEEMQKDYKATAERELSHKDPDEVSDAFMHALFDDEPLRRYMVVPNERQQEMTISTKVRELVQLNEWGPYSYSRDQLVEMLDAALAGDAASE